MAVRIKFSKIFQRFILEILRYLGGIVKLSNCITNFTIQLHYNYINNMFIKLLHASNEPFTEIGDLPLPPLVDQLLEVMVCAYNNAYPC